MIIALYIIGSLFTILGLVTRLSELRFKLDQIARERDDCARGLTMRHCPMTGYPIDEGHQQ